MKTIHEVLPAKNKSPRTEARPAKLDALSPKQKAQLIRWLKVEKVVYKEAKARIARKFGISVSLGGISNFWHRHCVSRRAPDVLLDIVIQSTAPVRLLIRRRNHSITLLQNKK